MHHIVAFDSCTACPEGATISGDGAMAKIVSARDMLYVLSHGNITWLVQILAVQTLDGSGGVKQI